MRDTKLKVISVLFLMLFTLTLFFFLIDEKEHNNYKTTSNNKIDSLTKVIDSLDEVNFGLKVDNMRHELTREVFFHNNPKMLKEYEDFYTHETE